MLTGRLSLAPPWTATVCCCRQDALMRLDRLVGLRSAVVIGVDALAIEDHAAGDGDAIGFSAQRPAHGVGEVGPHACGPARSTEVATNSEFRLARTSCVTSGGASGGGVSMALARMNSGTGAWLSAMPQPASA